MRARTIEEWMRDKERDAPPADRRYRALVPAKFHELTWCDYREDAKVGDETLKGILQHYADNWTAETTEGLTVLGPPGFGKTMGMALLACELIDKGAWVRWTTFAELTRRKRDLFGLARQAELADDWSKHEEEELRIRWIERDCDVLFLDDVGKEYRAASGWSDAELDNLLRSRTAASKVTMITSNLMWKDWKQYSESMASFLREIGEVVRITDGSDHREDTAPTSMRSTRRAAR